MVPSETFIRGPALMTFRSKKYVVVPFRVTLPVLFSNSGIQTQLMAMYSTQLIRSYSWKQVIGPKPAKRVWLRQMVFIAFTSGELSSA